MSKIKLLILIFTIMAFVTAVSNDDSGIESDDGYNDDSHYIIEDI